MAGGSIFVSSAHEKHRQFQHPGVRATLRARAISPRLLSGPLLCLCSLYEIVLILRYCTYMYKCKIVRVNEYTTDHTWQTCLPRVNVKTAPCGHLLPTQPVYERERPANSGVLFWYFPLGPFPIPRHSL